MRERRKTRLLRRLVLGFAVAALVAPAAQARVDEGGAARSGGGSAVIRGEDRVLALPGGTLVIRGDDKVFQPFELVPALVGDGEERYAPTSGFDWGDGLIGAFAGFGLALLAFGFTATRHLRRPATT